MRLYYSIIIVICMIKVLVTGGDGQLGMCFKHIRNNHSFIKFYFLNKSILDITNYQSILKFIKKNDLDYIINCAAYTLVDKAEIETEEARIINVIGVQNLIRVSEIFKIKLIHISTDYVFDGYGGIEIKELDNTNPLGVYGKTKLSGEKLILKSTSKAIVVRTSWLFSPFGNNFVKTIIKLSNSKKKISVINDQFGKPTYGIDLAEVIIKFGIILVPPHGLLNSSNLGLSLSFDFAKSIITTFGSLDGLKISIKLFAELKNKGPSILI